MALTRRTFLQTLSLLGLSGISARDLFAQGREMITRPIPASGERLPVIGMGTWQTFDTAGGEETERLLPVLRAFFQSGGALIDTSPMYGRAEEVLGELLPRARGGHRLFAATKVWTHGKSDGVRQMQRSMRRVGVAKFDLIQVHNLRDWQVHLETLKQWKREGKVRYIGVTTSHGRRHEELAEIMARQPLDFVQFTYNLRYREAEQRLLPLAREHGMAVIINRPLDGGGLFSAVRGLPLPKWASEFDCQAWSQFFLKYIVSHPAVSCAIPATSRVDHMRENMGAMYGRLPDPEMRRRMAAYLQKL
jgi:diketogulonate reductase-like aldo/keto reductase